MTKLYHVNNPEWGPAHQKCGQNDSDDNQQMALTLHDDASLLGLTRPEEKIRVVS